MSGIDFTTATPVPVTDTLVPNINITLTLGGTISGVIHARGTSTALAGVPVFIFRFASNTYLFRNPSGVVTDSNGLFTFQGLRDGDWIVRVEPLGYTISYYSGDADNPATDSGTATPVHITGANTVSNVNINPALGGGQISGQILRSDTSVPVGNLVVQLRIADVPRTSILPRASFVSQTITNSNGVYIFSGLSTGDYIVHSLGTQVANGTAVAFSNGVAAGIEGCSISPGATSPETALPVPVTSGFLTDCVNFTVPGFSGEDAFPRTISGTVRDAFGNPVPFASVSVEDSNGFGVAFANVRGDGSYTALSLALDQYRVRVTTESTWERRWFDDELALRTGDLVDVTSSNQVGIDFFLPATAGTITGKITRADTGQPVMGASVRARNFFTSFFGGANTQRDGTFLIRGLPAGNYKIDVLAPGLVPRYYTTNGAGGLSSADASFVLVQNSLATTGINVDLAPSTGGIQGTVTTPGQGALPVAGGLVEVWNAANGSIVAFAVTRSDGSFVVPDLGAGQYKLAVIASGFATQWWNSKATLEAADTITVGTGTVSLDQLAEGSAFNLSPSQGSISGFVVFQSLEEVSPLEEAGVRIFDAVTGGFVNSVGGLTNRNGFYRIASLPPSTAGAPGTFSGGYLAQAIAPGFASRYFNGAATTSNATALTVMDGIDTSNTNFTLTSAPQLDSLSVTSAGQGASGLTVVITGLNLAANASFRFLVNGVNDPCITASNVTFVSSIQLILTLAVSPCAQAGPHDVMITETEPGGTFTLPGAFIVTSAPQVLSTNRGSANPLFTNVSTQTVSINGTGFQPSSGSPLSVMFSGTGITVNSVQFTSPVEIAAVVDVADGVALSPRTVTVVNPDLGTGTSATAIVALATAPPGAPVGLAPSTTPTTPPPAPTLSGLNPSAGLLGGSVILAGTGFSTTLIANSVTFAGFNGTRVSALVTAATTTQLTVTVPANATDGPVTVAVNGQVSNPQTFTVSSPLLSAVIPGSGAQGASFSLTLTGTKFSPPVTVTFSGTGITPLTPTVSSDGTTITLPISINAGATLGGRSVTVTNSTGGSSTLANAFTVTAPQNASFTFSVQGFADPSFFLPSVDQVMVTLDATGRCTAKAITPHPVILTATLATGPGVILTQPPPSVTFTLTSSAIQGTATNEDCELGPTPTKDFSFSATDPSVQQTSVSGSGGPVYTTTLYSWDWGGSVSIQVTGTAVLNTGTQTVTGTQMLPVDTDRDGLPDAYERDLILGANAIGTTPLSSVNPDQNGNGIPDGQDRFARDGLSNFSKYRGIYLAGPAPGRSGLMMTDPTNPTKPILRLEVGQRHLFAWGRGFGTDPLVQAANAAGNRSCGVTVDPTTGAAGGPAPDSTISAANPCPPFDVGGAFAAINVKVHDVSASFTAPAGSTAFSTVFPTQSLVSPTTALLDVATVKYDATNCRSGEVCQHTSKVGVRSWTFPTLGFSIYGTSTAYGSDIRVFKTAVDAYFGNKPYRHQTNLPSTIVLAPDGVTPMLAPITLVCDSSSKGADNGALEGNECTVGGVLGGDVYVPGSFTQDLSAMDVTNDSCPELPFVTDPKSVARCVPNTSTDPTGPVGPYPNATKRQVVRHLITHELGHGAGVNLHTTDSTDVMYQYTIDWIRDGFNGSGHFSTTAAPLIQIHNGGLQ